MDIHSLPTPSLLLDVARVRRNAERIGNKVKSLGATLRPHIKTHKCIEVARIQTKGQRGGVTVSTLAEARAFAEHGFLDITYAVPIEPGKFESAIDLTRQCEKFSLLTDDLEIPPQLNEAARRADIQLDLFVKVDCGYHRCGVDPRSKEAIELVRLIEDQSNVRFAGILTHAGHSYHFNTRKDLTKIARIERDVMNEFEAELRALGIEVPTVSIGSTPTVAHIDHLEGIDEVRPGNYVFFDAFQSAAGNCSINDAALTVLAAVVHRNRARKAIVIDAGSIALSKDRGPVEFDPKCGYGLVMDMEGNILDARITSLSQEHGAIDVEDVDVLDRLRVGTLVRVVANHSCLTATQHSHYNVVEDDEVVDRWEIIRGW